MKKKIIFTSLIIFCIFVGLIFIKNNIYSSFITYDQIQLIKKIIFPYKLIEKQEELILKNDPINRELEFKSKSKDIRILKNTQLSNGKLLKIFNLSEGFYSGIHDEFTGSGYLDFHKDNLFILSSRGILAFAEDLSKNAYFKQIKNNINNFIGPDQFYKNQWFSLKDLLIYKDKVFISYTEEIKEYCWNTSLIVGDISYEKIEFKKIFSPKECIHTKNNIDQEFNAHQSGGRIISFDNDTVLLSIGDYRSRFLAQDKNSINGKIIKINFNNYDHEIISMGHRNPQGLYFDINKNFILETEHGPKGGDEINLIKVEEINKNSNLNYGWPIVSAGEHYVETDEKLKKYPLYKSHSEYGFLEPLKSFVPSIGISEITKIGNNRYVVGSLKNKSLYYFEINNKKISNLERVNVFERVRDLKFHSNNLYLFLENSASIGLINYN